MNELLSQACKQLVCKQQQSEKCTNCATTQVCSWYQLFAKQISTDPEKVKRHQKPSLPFVFSFPIQSIHTHTPAIDCRLVVIGSAISHLNVLLSALETVVTRFSNTPILSILSRDYQGDITSLQRLNVDTLAVMSFDTWSEVNNDLDYNCLQIDLITPLRLMSNAKQMNHFDIRQFMRMVIRRTSSIANYYADYTFYCDYCDVVNKVDSLFCLEDNFSYCAEKGLRGVIGTGLFKGDFESLRPFLKLGSLLHVGKGATYGWGEFRVRSAK